tara:strand:- start:9929 stop:12295 length:2367 start_codon:yes stop_codon:yes gene_type:complete
MPNLKEYWNILASSAAAPDRLVGSDGQAIAQDFVGATDGTVAIEATEADGTTGGPEKLRLMANSGVPMRLTGYADPVIVKMEGAIFAKDSTPIIADHDIGERIGHTTIQAVIPHGQSQEVGGQTVSGPNIVAMGLRSSNSDAANSFVADARKNFPFQVSIGARILDGEFIAQGETVVVNGRQWDGPLIVANKTLIREVTVTVLGADGNTSATLAAKMKNSSYSEIHNTMNFEAYVSSLGLDIKAMSTELRATIEAQYKAVHPPTGTPVVPAIQASVPAGIPTALPVDIQAAEATRMEARRKADAIEDLRTGDIRASVARYADTKIDYADQKDITASEAGVIAVREGHDSRDLELVLLRASRSSSAGPSIHIKNSSEIDGKALSCAMLRINGVPGHGKNKRSGSEYGLETMFNEATLEASHSKQYQINSISQLFDMQIRAGGGYYSGTDRHGGDFTAEAVKAWQAVQSQGSTLNASGFSSLNITNVLENTMHKASLAAFGASEGVWRSICGRQNLSDFRPHNQYRMAPDGTYKKVGVTGELKHVGMSDTKYTIQAETYGAMITIDRKTRKNDDLGGVINQARGLGTLGAQRIEESVFVLLLSNPGSFFHANNSNLITGATTALGTIVDDQGLDQARQLFRNQLVNGKPVSVSPSILLAGTKLETTANRLYNQDRTEAAADSTGGQVFNDNPHTGLYQPVISPYLNNTSITDEDGAALSGQSDTLWYLLGDPNSPQGSVITIGFMDGIETPHFDEAETQFNVPDGLQMRSYLDWGVAMQSTELGVKSAGA